MWTCMTLRTLVPEGFNDSGWCTSKYYVTAKLTKEDAAKAILKYLRQTEVTRAVFLDLTYVAPFKPAWHQDVLTADGAYADQREA